MIIRVEKELLTTHLDDGFEVFYPFRCFMLDRRSIEVSNEPIRPIQ